MEENSLKRIIASYEAIKLGEGRAVLATIVTARGALRHCTGSRVIVREDGTSSGSVGDQALQKFLIERARKNLESERPQTVFFAPANSPANEAPISTPGSAAQILFEPLQRGASSLQLRFLADCLLSKKSGVVASVFRVDGEVNARVGTHSLLYEDGKIEEDIRNPVLMAALTEDCIRARQSKSSFVSEYRFTEGVVEASIEFIAGS